MARQTPTTRPARPARPRRSLTGNGKFQLVAFPPAGRDRHPADDADQRRRVLNGRITDLTVKAPDGAEIPGYLDTHGTWWLTKANLAAGHRVPGRRRTSCPNHGKPHREHWTFRTITPSTGARRAVVPGDNEVVGVGQPISVRFTSPVANKAAVEARLKVTTSVPVAGSWHWMSDREVHWRPADYWPAHTAGVPRR